jgi:hypothetical protein
VRQQLNGSAELPASEKKERVTIANYSAWKSLVGASILLGLALIFIYGWLDFAISRTSVLNYGVYATYALAMGSSIYLAMLPLLWKIFRQVLFDGRRVIWKEDERLIYLDANYLAVSCSEISEISLSYNKRDQEGIELLLVDGSRKFLPTGGLSISSDEVERRIKGICFPVRNPT